jgi:hypothetical protein
MYVMSADDTVLESGTMKYITSIYSLQYVYKTCLQ